MIIWKLLRIVSLKNRFLAPSQENTKTSGFLVVDFLSLITFKDIKETFRVYSKGQTKSIKSVCEGRLVCGTIRNIITAL